MQGYPPEGYAPPPTRGASTGVVVRGGCLGGDPILGTACGARGFGDVAGTPTGCRFTGE